MGGTKFHPHEFPRSGSKAKDVEERRRVGNNKGQIRIAKPPRVAHVSRLGQYPELNTSL